MSASLLVHIPAEGNARSGVEELVRLLVEEADGVFETLRFDTEHLDNWQRWLEEHAPDVARMVNGAPSDSEFRGAEQLGRAFVRSFADEDAEVATKALAETTREMYRSARLPSETMGASSALHDALADPVLPDEQRRSMIRCMYGVLIATAGEFELPLQEFADPATAGTNAADRRLRAIATEVATPDTLRFKIWNDCLDLLRARSRTMALAVDSAESLTSVSGNGLVLIRGSESYAPILVLANPTSDVIEVSIDRRLLPVNIGKTFRDEITGDMLFLPYGGDNCLSVDLEPYEVMWLSLRPEPEEERLLQ